MKKTFLTILSGLVASVIFLATAQAFEADINGNVDLKVTSAYIWRGVVVNDEPCVQPAVIFSSDTWAFTVNGSWDLTKVEDSAGDTRVDTTLDYGWTSGKHMLRPGVVAYIYQDESGSRSKDTFEVFTEYALDIPALPSLTVYYDFGEIGAFYTTLSISHDFNIIKDKFPVELRASVGAAEEKYNNAIFSFPADEEKGIEAFQPDKSSLVDLTLGGSVTIPVSKDDNAQLVPGIKYMTLLDSEIKNGVKDAGEKASEIAYSLTYSFYF